MFDFALLAYVKGICRFFQSAGRVRVGAACPHAPGDIYATPKGRECEDLVNGNCQVFEITMICILSTCGHRVFEW